MRERLRLQGQKVKGLSLSPCSLKDTWQQHRKGATRASQCSRIRALQWSDTVRSHLLYLSPAKGTASSWKVTSHPACQVRTCVSTLHFKHTGVFFAPPSHTPPPRKDRVGFSLSLKSTFNPWLQVQVLKCIRNGLGELPVPSQPPLSFRKWISLKNRIWAASTAFRP